MTPLSVLFTFQVQSFFLSHLMTVHTLEGAFRSGCDLTGPRESCVTLLELLRARRRALNYYDNNNNVNICMVLRVILPLNKCRHVRNKETNKNMYVYCDKEIFGVLFTI